MQNCRFLPQKSLGNHQKTSTEESIAYQTVEFEDKSYEALRNNIAYMIVFDKSIHCTLRRALKLLDRRGHSSEFGDFENLDQCNRRKFNRDWSYHQIVLNNIMATFMTLSRQMFLIMLRLPKQS